MTEEQDRFGLKHMTTNQEVAVSFTLFIIGNLLVITNLLPLIGHFELSLAALGLVVTATGYLFMVESVRELEEKDHFLARKLRKKED